MKRRRNEVAGETGDLLEKPRRPAALSGTTPTCENTGAIPPGIEPGSPRWEANSLTTTPPQPHPASIHQGGQVGSIWKQASPCRQCGRRLGRATEADAHSRRTQRRGGTWPALVRQRPPAGPPNNQVDLGFAQTEPKMATAAGLRTRRSCSTVLAPTSARRAPHSATQLHAHQAATALRVPQSATTLFAPESATALHTPHTLPQHYMLHSLPLHYDVLPSNQIFWSICMSLNGVIDLGPPSVQNVRNVNGGSEANCKELRHTKSVECKQTPSSVVAAGIKPAIFRTRSSPVDSTGRHVWENKATARAAGMCQESLRRDVGAFLGQSADTNGEFLPGRPPRPRSRHVQGDNHNLLRLGALWRLRLTRFYIRFPDESGRFVAGGSFSFGDLVSAVIHRFSGWIRESATGLWRTDGCRCIYYRYVIAVFWETWSTRFGCDKRASDSAANYLLPPQQLSPASPCDSRCVELSRSRPASIKVRRLSEPRVDWMSGWSFSDRRRARRQTTGEISDQRGKSVTASIGVANSATGRVGILDWMPAYSVNPSRTCQHNGVTGEQRVGSPFANQRLVSCLSVGSLAPWDEPHPYQRFGTSSNHFTHGEVTHRLHRALILAADQGPVAPPWFETRSEIRSKIYTKYCCTTRIQSWTGASSAAIVDKLKNYAYFHDVIYYEPIAKFVSHLFSIAHFGIKIDESEIQNHEISLVQHFYIGTKIKLYPGLELGSFDLGSGKIWHGAAGVESLLELLKEYFSAKISPGGRGAKADYGRQTTASTDKQGSPWREKTPRHEPGRGVKDLATQVLLRSTIGRRKLSDGFERQQLHDQVTSFQINGIVSTPSRTRRSIRLLHRRPAFQSCVQCWEVRFAQRHRGVYQSGGPHRVERRSYHTVSSPVKDFIHASDAVAERLDCSPPIKADRIQSPTGSLLDFHKWESCLTMPLVGGFSRRSPIYFFPRLGSNVPALPRTAYRRQCAPAPAGPAEAVLLNSRETSSRELAARAVSAGFRRAARHAAVTSRRCLV
ncbi:hypothetical protein PR048_006861 [Dryococelus australis]|uniref:Uncharacterized protein n=1 Tax=Dryococelus australis TaxID=614101 RepID=A0ABQ9IDD7_9NEOP|nr:hypothetical protein PR048_006861 [Dryococelus australis]